MTILWPYLEMEVVFPARRQVEGARAGVQPQWWPPGVPFRTIGDMSGNHDLQTVIRAVATQYVDCLDPAARSSIALHGLTELHLEREPLGLVAS